MWRIGVTIAIVLLAEAATPARAKLPSQLSDQEFWSLIERTSEPNGYFRSDNLVSDEVIFRMVVPLLAQRARTGGAYLGVGPEQNFTYIAALESPMAFVLDIRRENLLLQLMYKYKALFELSADRSEFLARLFTKPRPQGLTSRASANDLTRAYWTVASSERPVFQKNLSDVKALLTTRHHLPLSDDDLNGIEKIYYSFYWYGPSIRWESSIGGGTGARSGSPTFVDLINQTGENYRELSFLSTEARFTFVQKLQSRNLVVPVVGNFAGPKALRAIGAYLRERSATVDAFYVSEVEGYLVHDGLWPAFCGNLASLPTNGRSVLIRPSLSGLGWPGPTIGVSQGLRDAFETKQPRLVPIGPEVRACRPGGPSSSQR